MMDNVGHAGVASQRLHACISKYSNVILFGSSSPQMCTMDGYH